MLVSGSRVDARVVAWCPHWKGFVSVQESGPRVSQEARARGLQSRPGTGCRSLLAARASEPLPGSREATGKLWEKLCQLCFRRGRGCPNGPASGWPRSAGWAPSQAWAPDAARAGLPGGPLAPRLRPCIVPTWPEPLGLQAARVAQRPERPGLGNLALSASEVIFLHLSRIILFHLTRAVSPLPFLCFSLSFCLSHFLYIRFLGHRFLFSFFHSLIGCFLCFPLDHSSVHFSQFCSLPLPLFYVSFFLFLTLTMSLSVALVLSFFPPSLSSLCISFVDFLVCLSGSPLLFLSRICPLPPWICLPGGAPSSSILGDENVVLLDAEARSG
ncbi:uncharacterized protein LOC116665753 isoform X2 [Camelus ferus]|uniref:Uncharacterized protein LOC116665753 isoform X2 n=1 Tax=Camelus ferus TaxID=419612 RepID=A0A8B8TJ26_CAMFR|nr:uncharacterized protein LOC116665753 isoform X2 [Camelus ferus]